jgi:DNA-binding SARP family transcriptional activator
LLHFAVHAEGQGVDRIAVEPDGNLGGFPKSLVNYAMMRGPEDFWSKRGMSTEEGLRERRAREQPIRISLLGGVRVRGLQGQGLGGSIGRTHARALIALAGSSVRGVSRDEVADALWPRQGEQAARNRLYHTVHLVRQALSALAWDDEWIVFQQGQVMFDPRVACDAHVLEGLAQSLDRQDDATILQALDLCEGEWAPEVEAGTLGQTIRRHLHDCRVALLREGARRLAAGGDTPARRDLLQRILALLPTDDWAYQQMMQVELEAQRPHAALRLFDAARRAMVAQLGLRPSVALIDLAGRAQARLDADPSGPASPEAAALIGRGALLTELTAELRAGPGVWVLHGLAGVGKTALARELARRADMPARWVTLTPGQPAAGLLGPAWEGALWSWQDASAGRSAPWGLVVIDQLDLASDGQTQLCALVERWSASPAAERVLLLLHTAPALPAWPAGWHGVAVQPLALPAEDARPAEGSQSPAVALFQLLRPSPDPDLSNVADWRDLVALVRRLDGLPLALELAAARTVTLTPGEVLRQLDGPLGLNALDPPAADGRPTLALSLERSLQQLSGPARAHLRLISVFQTPFTAEAVQRLAQVAALEVERGWPALLKELRGLGLLVTASLPPRGERTEADEPVRLLHLVRDQGRREAQALGVWPSHLQAHVDVVIAALEAGQCGIEDPAYLRWMSDIARLHDEALCLLPHVLHTDPARYLGLLLPMAQSWALRLLPLTLLRWVDAGRALAKAHGRHDVNLTLACHAARMCLESRALDEALSYSLDAIESAPTYEDPVQRSFVIATRALVLKAAGSLKQAQDLLAEALPHRAPDAPGHAALLVAQALLEPTHAAGAVASPMPLSHWRERLGGSGVWWDLLTMYSEAAANPDAGARLAVAEELLATARELKSTRRVEIALARMAWVQLALDDLTAATATVYEWYALSRSAERWLQAALACVWLAEVAWRQHDLATASRWLAVARQMLQDDPASTVHHAIHAHAMAVAALDGDVEEAAKMLLAVGTETIARCATFPLLERATEAGALLARHAGLDHLSRSLSESLSQLTHPNNVVPLVLRMRQQAFGDAVVPGPNPQSIQAASDRARADLTVLHEYFERAQRRARPS